MRQVLWPLVAVATVAFALLTPAVGQPGFAPTAPALVWSPTTSTGTYDYGPVSVGGTVPQAFTLKNSGNKATAQLAISLTGSTAFTKTADTCNSTKLAPNATCSVTVRYAPTGGVGATDQATLTASSNKVAMATLALKGEPKAAAPTITTAPAPATAPVGTVLQDTGNLVGGFSPTGSILFALYPTANCSGPVAYQEKVTVGGNGTYKTTTGYAAVAAGTYEWVASYSGDANNTPASTNCGDEPVTISPAAPALTTSPQPASGPVGTVLQDTGTLSGGFSPTGSISFTLYAGSDCSGPVVDQETVPVNGNGSYSTSSGYQAAAAGTYQWTASYSGDAGNSQAVSGCGQEPVTVSGPVRHVYWTNNNDNAIGRANVDGSGASELITGVGNPKGIAVDGNHLYWVSAANNSIGRANLDGSNANPNFISGFQSLTGVAVDANYIYWSWGNGIGRANLDGSNVINVFVPVQGSTDGLAVDASFIYWADQTNNLIGRANLNGSNPNPSFITQATGPFAVAVNATSIYWTNKNGSIGRANIDGSNPNQAFISNGVNSPRGITLDSSFIYWTNNSNNTIGRANLDGSNPNPTFIQNTKGPYGITVDAG